ncbi:hypothetical protein VE03_06058 [Pseudogymnoascus sp. 23342-1-I1]|nr:hypothetical protein VE03_06058 [Pseudogymnoascus sp. 23342-1-I1]
MPPTTLLPPLIPPPAYTPRAPDIETSSLLSAAPSYHSTAPPYTSHPPPHSRHPTPLTPSLADYHPTSWSRHASPSSRHYDAIAERRARAATARDTADLLAAARVERDPGRAARRVMEEREREEFGAGGRVRPLEDVGLVGEEAAGRARREREWREGVEVLVREDGRWDWLLAQMEDWDERERSWKRFRTQRERTRTERVVRKLGLVGFMGMGK